MKTEHQNPFDALAQLEINTGNKQDLFDDTEVFAELRVDEDELEIEDIFVSIGVSQANLELEIWGCEILPGTRHNDTSKAAIHGKLTSTRDENAARALSADVGSSLAKSNAKVNAQASRGSARRSRVEYTHEWATNFVRCLPGNRWRISDPADVDRIGVLKGTFIANERLCAVSSRPDYNLVDITARLTIRRRDIVAKPEGNLVSRELRKRTHQEKFVKAILAKAIVEGSNQTSYENQNGKIVIGMSHLSGEDDDGN